MHIMNLLPQYFKAVMLTVCALLLSQVAAAADGANVTKHVVGDFSQGDLADWQQKSFDGNTHYQLLSVDGRQVLKASSEASASALYRTIQVDLVKTPILHWSWRVDAVDPRLNPREKAGDDFPARIYVVKKGLFPWQTKALNYVWANEKSEHAFWPNPFTGSAVMIPVQAGQEGLGRWHSQQVDVVADFQRVFNLSVDEIDGVAIMSDSDNGKGSTTAYFGELFFSTRP